MSYLFEPPSVTALPVAGGGTFPVRRIFCVGKNYAAHVAEMGGDAKKDPPVFFTKPTDAATVAGEIPYAPGTDDLHYEGELVVALKSGGLRLAPGEARAHIFGFAAGCDLTRRDLQAAAKQAGAPWDAAKAFDLSAPIGEIAPIEQAGDIETAQLSLSVNGQIRQSASLSEMIWPVDEIVATLSGLFELKAGDLIFTGTPEGVGPLAPGDEVRVDIGALRGLAFKMTDAR